MLLELEIEVGVGKPARSPVLKRNDVARLGLEIVMECPAPAVPGEDLRFGRAELIGRGIVKGEVIASLPPMMRHEDDPERAGPRGRYRLAQMVQELDCLGDCVHAWPELAALAEEVVIGVDQKDRGYRGIVIHARSFS